MLRESHERFLAYQREYYAKNREKTRNYLIKNRERIRERTRAYHARPEIRGRYLSLKRAHYYANRDKYHVQHIEWVRKNPERAWALSTISRHQRNGHSITFDTDWLMNLAKATKRCPLCDCEINYTPEAKNRKIIPQSPSLDRKDNGLTLTPENTWIVCHRCNGTKRDRVMAEFVDYCGNIAEKFGRI